MEDYLIGDLVRRLRKQRGLTQEELADGILSKTNLSRLETGGQLPRKDTLEAILQRLGFNSHDNYNYFLNEREFEISKKSNDLLSLLANNRNQEADALINELSLLPEFKNGIKAQFLLLCRAVVMVNLRLNNDELREIVLKALKITFPSFSEKYISKYFLSDQEVRLVNILSITYLNENKVDKAIEILEKLKEALDSAKIDDKQRSELYTLILYNLSKYYGLSKRYIESIKICDFGRELCLKTNKMRHLPGLIYNKAYCLYEIGYRDECIPLLYQAYYGYIMLGDRLRRDIIKNHAKEKHGLDFDKK